MAKNQQLRKYKIIFKECPLKKEEVGKGLTKLEGARAVVVTKDKDGDILAYTEFWTRRRRRPEFFIAAEKYVGIAESCRHTRNQIFEMTKYDEKPFTWKFNVKACKSKHRAHEDE